MNPGRSTAPSYGDILAGSTRARSRKRPGQASVVARMRALGYARWHRQTMGKVERGERRLTAEEILALALVLETSVGQLLDPDQDVRMVALPSGQPVEAGTIRGSVRHRNDGMVRWQHDQPGFDLKGPPSSVGFDQPGIENECAAPRARAHEAEAQNQPRKPHTPRNTRPELRKCWP